MRVRAKPNDRVPPLTTGDALIERYEPEQISRIATSLNWDYMDVEHLVWNKRGSNKRESLSA